MGRHHLCNHLCNHLCIATSVATSVTTFRWDGTTAYGYRWPASGRAGDRASGYRADRYRLSARNSGLFFVQVSHGDSEPKFNVARYHSGLFFAQATHEALRMMLRLPDDEPTRGSPTPQSDSFTAVGSRAKSKQAKKKTEEQPRSYPVPRPASQPAAKLPKPEPKPKPSPTPTSLPKQKVRKVDRNALSATGCGGGCKRTERRSPTNSSSDSSTESMHPAKRSASEADSDDAMQTSDGEEDKTLGVTPSMPLHDDNFPPLRRPSPPPAVLAPPHAVNSA